MAKKESANKHITNKDDGDEAAKKIGNVASVFAMNVKTVVNSRLVLSSDKKPATWLKMQQTGKIAFAKALNSEQEKATKAIQKVVKETSLTEMQKKKIILDTSKEFALQIEKQKADYQQQVNKIYKKALFNASAGGIAQYVRENVDTNMQESLVEYKSGKRYRFEDYMEMKQRTEIQKEISQNMIQDGHDMGAIFYICSFFGDCAKDHADFQGKIYIDKDWRNVTNYRIDEIEDYIKMNNILNVQDVTEVFPYLTTRPNCRHHFDYISIDDVLGIKSENDLNEAREDLNLNFNGKYQPEKYEALQKQRILERHIRRTKEEIYKNNVKFQTFKKEALTLDEEIERAKLMQINASKIKELQETRANLRGLIKENDNLVRSYRNESSIGQKLTKITQKENSLIKDDLTKAIKNVNLNLEKKKLEKNGKEPVLKDIKTSNESVFVYASNIKEAEDYARTTLSIKNCTFKGMTLEHVNNANKCVTKIYDKFPALKGYIKGFGTAQELNKQIKEVAYKLWYDELIQQCPGWSPWCERTAKQYANKCAPKAESIMFARHLKYPTTHKIYEELNEEFRGIQFNKEWFKDGSIEEAYLSNVNSNFHPKGTTAQAVITHELGHALDSLINLNNNEDFLNYYRTLTRKDIENGLSRYANENKKEFIAEAFAEYIESEEPREIANNVGKLIEKAYKDYTKTKGEIHNDRK